MFLRSCLVLLTLCHALTAAPTSLFDGRTLDGWEGDPRWWRVENGLLTGGSRTEKVPRNFFLATTRSFQNFELTLQLRLSGTPGTGLINSGVQIRSVRVPESTEMSGYQVDAGDGWWGKLYDESRRNKVVGNPVDNAAAATVKPGAWVDYRIRTEGSRIRSWINGVAALDYTETEPNIAQDGQIGIQIHSGGIALIEVRHVFIEELPPTPDAPTWDRVGRPKAKPPAPKAAAAPAAPTPAPSNPLPNHNVVTTGPRPPEQERRAFTVPPGFEVELVAAESPGFGKFIGLAWDARMRLWSMTALEYPVDGNEQKAASDALFAAGGRDKVVVFDHPYATPAAGEPAVREPPRVFADGLVMPLGVLPYRDGAFVQYGSDIRFYRDADGDGRADGHRVVLTGFGTQDSHLFPHQFLRQPGNQIFVAQGLFNYSSVRRPGGAAFADGTREVAFNQCKLGRFTPDGASFESLTAGPNNIWGMTTARDGETFIQEANDMGYPVIPYEPGVWVVTGSKDRLRPYQPLMPPPLAPAQMGGTGLSGLALAEDADGCFQRFGSNEPNAAVRVFFLANPITNTINAVRATPEGNHYRFEKLPDFLTSTDRWFRPVAIHFGPDGALYVVDWYNQIISHNEVPRTHPDRDKTRGRIWRIRHRDQPRVTPPDLTRLADDALVARLGDTNALVARLAWQEIIDRGANRVAPELARLAADATAKPDRRLGALWALEGLRTVTTPELLALARDPAPALRREAVRIAAAQPRPELDFVAVAAPLVNDPRATVRAAVGDALRRIPQAGEATLRLAAQLAQPPLTTGEAWARYQRDFERYLARWAMEVNPSATRALLAATSGPALSAESRLLALLALGGRDAARGIAQLGPQLGRPPTDEEIRQLALGADEPAIKQHLAALLEQPALRSSTLRALLAVRHTFDATALQTDLTRATNALLAGTAGDITLGAEVAGAFRLTASSPALVAALDAQSSNVPVATAVLRALRETSTGPVAPLMQIIVDPTHAKLHEDAVAALAASTAADAPQRLIERFPQLTPRSRGIALERLSDRPDGARALLAALAQKQLTDADLGLGAAERMRMVLPQDAAAAELHLRLGGGARRVLRLPGAPKDFPEATVSLRGAFTVECWLRLDPDISARDGIIGAPGQFDVNFFDGRVRVWLPEGNDVVVGTRPAAPGAWTHYAVTRDERGVYRLYLNGELDGTSAPTSNLPFTDLRVARSRANPAGGVTAGAIDEFRVWNVARTPAEIRAAFDRTFADLATTERPAGLQRVFAGADWGLLSGAAKAAGDDEAPVLLTRRAAEEQEAKFARFRILADRAGNAARGRELFTNICLACHQQGGRGGNLAPALDGVGVTGTEALLRNILTPNAAMESAYRIYRVTTRDGRVHEGFLAEDSPLGVVLRFPGAEERKIARGEIQSAGFLRRSLMPEGLLEALPESDVSDLFAHLRSLR